jgi:hypothetical protein
MSKKFGDIPLRDGYVFRWMMTGDTVPEVYGWTEKDYSIVKGTTGWFRTTDAEAAAKIALSNLEEMGL